MGTSALTQGQMIDAIFCPGDSDGEQAGSAVGYDQVTEIEIGQCAGPMGWYDVAIIRRAGTGRQDEIVPVHMAEFIRINATESKHA